MVENRLRRKNPEIDPLFTNPIIFNGVASILRDHNLHFKIGDKGMDNHAAYIANNIQGDVRYSGTLRGYSFTIYRNSKPYKKAWVNDDIVFAENYMFVESAMVDYDKY